MHKADIRFAESAITDLQGIGSWYGDQAVPDVRDRVFKAIITDIEALQDHPRIGRIVPEFVYRLEPKRVRIERIWRSERLLSGLGDEDE